MPSRNRVTPMGDIEAIPLRGAWTGNRGILHSGQQITRFHASDLWITCVLRFKDRWLTIGNVRIPGLALRITHAEGPLPDGGSGQIFGTRRSRIAPVPRDGRGVQNGLPTGLGVEVRYAGYADLIGNGPDPGGIYLMLVVHGTGLGSGCRPPPATC